MFYVEQARTIFQVRNTTDAISLDRWEHCGHCKHRRRHGAPTNER